MNKTRTPKSPEGDLKPVLAATEVPFRGFRGKTEAAKKNVDYLKNKTKQKPLTKGDFSD